MLVYRLCRKLYAHPLNGAGAAISGARWNSKGTEIIYTAENRSLAMAEVAVHLSIATLPKDMVMLTISIPPGGPVLKINANELPAFWNCYPETSVLHHYGDDLVRTRKYLALKVPSAVTQGDFNYLINPNHQLIEQVKIMKTENFPFDKRIISL